MDAAHVSRRSRRSGWRRAVGRGRPAALLVAVTLLAGACTYPGPHTADDPYGGALTKVEYLGRLPLDWDDPYGPDVAPGRFDQDYWYVEFISDGGKVAAQLAVPVGDAPPDGWPVALSLPQLGGLGKDFWRWPYDQPEDWTWTRHMTALSSYARDGVAIMRIWYPGEGPSEPHATFSPFDADKNLPAVYDGFRALFNLAGLKPELEFDTSRHFLQANCVSSPTLMRFAAGLSDPEAPEQSWLDPKVLVADTFQPSIATVSHVRWVYGIANLQGRPAANFLGLYAGPAWALADSQGWPRETFFTPRAIEVLSQPFETPAGVYELMRGAILEPATESQVGPVIFAAATADLGHEPTALELRDWLFSPAVRAWIDLPTIEAKVADPFYRQYFAEFDPFFEENIEPFSPGIPVISVALGGNLNFEIGNQYIWQPIVDRLTGWGWDLRTFNDHTETTSMYGTGDPWAMQQIFSILYPDGVPAELTG